MTAIHYIALAVLLFIVILVVFKNKKPKSRFVKLSAQNIPNIRQGLISRQRFDTQLAARQTEGRFQRRDCTLLRFRFQTDNTGVDGAIVDLLVEHMQSWPVPHEFYISKVDASSFVVLVEDVALPDESRELEDLLHVHLDLPMGTTEQYALEFTLAHGSFPYDTDHITELWGVVAQRLSQRKRVSNTLALRPVVDVRGDGVLVIDLGGVEGVNYSNVEGAFQVYLDDYAPLYPGVKFPQLCKAERVLSLDVDAIRFTRSKAVVGAISAVAVAPRGSIEKHLMRMYAYYNQPPYPFKICSNEEEAIEWLQAYVDPKFFKLHKKELQRQASLSVVDETHGEVDRL